MFVTCQKADERGLLAVGTKSGSIDSSEEKHSILSLFDMSSVLNVKTHHH